MDMPIKAVIFDLDGTITEPYLDFDQIRREIGLGPRAGTILEEMEQMTADQRQRAFDIIERHEEQAVENSTLNPGARETLEWLRRRSMHIGIITRNRRQSADAVASKHGLMFDAIVDRDDGPVKPDAYGIHKLCNAFGVLPAETIVMGDFLHDIQAARAAGTVAVLLANHARADEFAKIADYTVMRVDEIIPIIKKINSSEAANA
jgi:HAD superfamily hydrolase (TIGR01509 family)